MNIRIDILWRVYLVYAIMLVFAGAVLWQLCKVEIQEGNYWREKAKNQSTRKKHIAPIRGNILSDNGSVLATSIPRFDMGLDGLVLSKDEDDLQEHIDSLSKNLHDYFGDQSAAAYGQEIRSICKEKGRYYIIKKGLNLGDLQNVKNFGVWDEGNFRKAFKFDLVNNRTKPFGNLASRTIGYFSEGPNPVGLEGAYQDKIKGHFGIRSEQKWAGGIWVPIQDEPEITPVDGDDIVSCINIQIQDMAQNALLKAMIQNQAHHGCVLVMEVHSGEIKAIANLTRKSLGNYVEDFNYAIGESTEPGSTFKLATYLLALESHKIDTNTLVDTHNGQWNLHHHFIIDSHSGRGIITAKKAFEESSNIAAATLINQSFENNPRSFTNGLIALGLNKKLGLPIPGEGLPRIKNPSSVDWSSWSLEQMAYGYEVKITPLQMLTFYNAIANDGVEMAPLLVKEIDHAGKPLQVFPSQILNPAICSSSTLGKLKKMLEGVISQGTGMDLKSKPYSLAGKTGTAQIAKGEGGYNGMEGKKYQASFCGYFPAQNPQYSIMVVINDPSSGKYYGSSVAEPVFGELADKIFAARPDLHPAFAYLKNSTPSF